VSTRSSKFYWKKQLMVLLAFVVVVSGFPAAFAPVAKAADSAPNLIVDYEFRDPGNGELPVDKLGNSKLEEVSGKHTHNGRTKSYGNATKGYGTDSAGSYWYWTAINDGGGGFTLDIKPVVDKNISRSYSVGVRFSYDKFNPNWTKIIDYKDKTTTEGFYFTGNGERKLMFYNVGTSGKTAAEPKQIVDIIATRNNDSNMFTAYMMINGEFHKEIEINDSNGKATPIELEDGTIRFGFFHDDLPTLGVERPEGGKVYSIKFWDGAITPAKALEATAAKGTDAGTKITATPESSNSLRVLVSDTLLPFPLQGEDVPAGAQEYTPGSDINDVDADTNKYVGVYEVDSSGKIVGFKLITLTANEIKEKPVNKDELKAKIDDIEGKLADGTLKAEDYTADSWQALQDELEKAKKVFEDPNATQEQVDNAKKALENAEMGLVPVTPAVDKSALQTKIEDIDGKLTDGSLKAEDYTAESWGVLQEELKKAKEVFANPNATQEQVENAKKALENAEMGLVPVTPAVDKSALQTKIEDIDGKLTDGSLKAEDYTAESWGVLQEELKKAKEVFANPNATQEQVENAKKALENAEMGLVPVTPAVDKSALQTKIEDIDGKLTDGSLKAEDYTAESWGVLQEELKKAKEVFANPNATQEQVDNAKTALENAVNNLVKLGGELKDWELIGLTEGGKKDIKLSPDFNPIQYKHYTATVTNDVYGISLNPTVEIPNGTQVKVYVNGTEYPAEQWSKLPLNEGQKNLVLVKVEDTAGNLINEYTIEITHEGSPAANNKLGSLVPSTGSLYPEFNPDTASYTMSVTNSVYQIQFKPTTQNPNAKIEIRVGANGKPQAVTSGEFSGYLDLNPGSNDIYILVTDENNVSKEYKVTVYRAYSNNSDNGSGGSSSGGTVTTSPSTGTGTVSKPLDLVTTVNGQQVPFATGTVTQTGDRTQTTVTVDAGKLSGALVGGKGQKLSISVPNNGDLTVQGLTVQQLKELKDSGSSLEIGNLLAIYPLPAGQLNLNRIAGQFGNASLSDIAVNVNVKRASNELNQLAREVAAKNGYELLVHPVDLDLSFTQGGQTIKAGKLNSYAAKYIALPEGVDPNRITTGVIVNPDGSVFHVPTVVTKINNRYFARINDLRASGTYSVIWNPKNYDDVMNHWAKASANDIGARLVIEGTGNNTFTPNRDINRSEFAVFIVKGLGLMRQDVEQNAFRDVPSSTWYHAAVTIASEFGIVLGYDDGAFHGEEYITREQGMAMIARAYRLIRPEASMNTEQMNAVLSGYGDGNKVSNWAKEAVALLISEGITEGGNGQLLKPQAKMTRAEAAAMIQRLLKTTGLID